MAGMLRLGSLGGKGGGGGKGGDGKDDDETRGPSADVDVLLAPEEAMGGEVLDIRAEVLAEVAVNMVAMLHSISAITRATVARW